MAETMDWSAMFSSVCHGLLASMENYCQESLPQKLEEIDEYFVWLNEAVEETFKERAVKSSKLEEMPKTPAVKQKALKRARKNKDEGKDAENQSPVLPKLAPSKLRFETKSPGELNGEDMGRPVRKCRKTKVNYTDETKEEQRKIQCKSIKTVCSPIQKISSKPVETEESISPLQKPSKRPAGKSLPAEEKQDGSKNSPSVIDRAAAYESMLKTRTSKSHIKTGKIIPTQSKNKNTSPRSNLSIQLDQVQQTEKQGPNSYSPMSVATPNDSCDGQHSQRTCSPQGMQSEKSSNHETIATTGVSNDQSRTRSRLKKRVQEKETKMVGEDIRDFTSDEEEKCKDPETSLEDEDIQKGTTEEERSHNPLNETQVIVTEVFEIKGKQQELKDYEEVKIKTTPVIAIETAAGKDVKSRVCLSSDQGFNDDDDDETPSGEDLLQNDSYEQSCTNKLEQNTSMTKLESPGSRKLSNDACGASEFSQSSTSTECKNTRTKTKRQLSPSSPCNRAAMDDNKMGCRTRTRAVKEKESTTDTLSVEEMKCRTRTRNVIEKESVTNDLSMEEMGSRARTRTIKGKKSTTNDLPVEEVSRTRTRAVKEKESSTNDLSVKEMSSRTRTRTVKEKEPNNNDAPVEETSSRTRTRTVKEKESTANDLSVKEMGCRTRTRAVKEKECAANDLPVEEVSTRTRTRQKTCETSVSSDNPGVTASLLQKVKNIAGMCNSDDEVITGSPAMDTLKPSKGGGKKRQVQDRGASPRPKRSRSYIIDPDHHVRSPLLTSSPIRKKGAVDCNNDSEGRVVALPSSPQKSHQAYRFSSAQKASTGFLNRTPGFVQNTSRLYSFMSNTPTCRQRGVLSSFLKRNTPPPKQNVQVIQEQKKQKLLEKESRDKARLLKAAELRKRKIEEQKKLREEKERKVAEAREAQLRMGIDQKNRINKKLEDKAILKEKLMEERSKEEKEKQKLRLKKQMEADERRKQEEEERLKKLLEMEEEAKMHKELMQRKREFEELERKRHIAEEKRKQEERMAEIEQKRREDLARTKQAEEDKERERERIRAERERQAAIERAEKERKEREKKEERERKLKEELEKLKILEKQRQQRQIEESQASKTASSELQQMISKHNSSITQPPATSSSLNTTHSVANKSSNCSSYEITPVRKPYTNYDIEDKGSDDSTDDDEAPKKKIPEWATGIALNTALIRQHLHPPDVEMIFQTANIEPPNLELIFKGSKKRRYRERTSSANWHSPMCKD